MNMQEDESRDQEDLCPLQGESFSIKECPATSDDSMGGQWPWRKRKQVETCLSHRHIEKRRRDRINRTLVRLKELVPSAMQKFKDRAGGRLEKAELLEMTIEYLQELQKDRKFLKEIQQGPKPKLEQDVEPTNSKVKPPVHNHTNDHRYIEGFKDGVSHVLKSIRDLGMLGMYDISSCTTVCCPEESVKDSKRACVGTKSLETHFTLDDLAEAAIQRRLETSLDNPERQSLKSSSAQDHHGNNSSLLAAISHSEATFCRKSIPHEVISVIEGGKPGFVKSVSPVPRKRQKTPDSVSLNVGTLAANVTNAPPLSSPLVAMVAPITTPYSCERTQATPSEVISSFSMRDRDENNACRYKICPVNMTLPRLSSNRTITRIDVRTTEQHP